MVLPATPLMSLLSDCTPLDMSGKIQSLDESIVNWVGAELEARGATNDMIYQQLITIGNYTGTF